MEKNKTKTDDGTRNQNSTNASNANIDRDEDLRRLEERWPVVQDSFREIYPKITDDDVKYNKGEFDNMLGRVENRTGKSRSALENEIRNWDNDSAKM